VPKNERVDREFPKNVWFCECGDKVQLVHCVSKAQARRLTMQIHGWMPDKVVEADHKDIARGLAAHGPAGVIYG
jgi:hypothetical protein